jgi:hypothetical protein
MVAGHERKCRGAVRISAAVRVGHWGWRCHSVERFAAGLIFEMFLTVLIGTMLVFLIAATPLPEVAADGADLRRHWDRASRRYWALFLVHWLLSTGVGL